MIPGKSYERRSDHHSFTHSFRCRNDANCLRGRSNLTNNDELYHRVESRVPEKLLVEYMRDNRPSVGAREYVLVNLMLM